jgi:fatty-acyl-CoA synthase
MIVPLTPLEFRLRATQQYGRKVGVVDGPKRFTYAEYGERADRLAGALRARGLGTGDVVSFLSFNCHQLLEAYYGVLQAGAILNPINIRLTPEEIVYVLMHSGTRAIVFHASLRPLAEKLRALLTNVPFIACESPAPIDWAEDYEQALAEATPLAANPDAVDENAVAELFYTSGTTGQPKGVALTHRSLYLHALTAMPAMKVGDDDVMLHVVPLFHVNGWGTPHTLTAAGGRHVMLRKFDPTELLRLVQEERVTKLLGVPAIFNALLNHPQLDQFDLSSLRVAILGGAPSSLHLVRAIEDRIGCQAIVGYGLTETSPAIMLSWAKDSLAGDRETRLACQAKTGMPIVGTRTRVVDINGADVAPDGRQVGEIIVRGNVVMDGYYRDPRATDHAIRDGWFYTGDMATVDEEGYTLIVDRKKDIIISGGENISSVEIENAIGGHPAVLECAVIAVPDSQWGEVPLAVVVVKPDITLAEADLREFLSGRLAHFKLPKHIHFAEQLPRGGTGKVLKTRLREPHWADQGKRVN